MANMHGTKIVSHIYVNQFYFLISTFGVVYFPLCFMWEDKDDVR